MRDPLRLVRIWEAGKSSTSIEYKKLRYDEDSEVMETGDYVEYKRLKEELRKAFGIFEEQICCMTVSKEHLNEQNFPYKGDVMIIPYAPDNSSEEV